MITLILMAAFVAFIAFAVCLIWRPARLALSLSIMILLALPATAQEPGGTGPLAMLMPLLIDLLAILLMAALTWATAWAKRKFGIEIEARHRDALHSALMTGARLAAARQLTGPAAVGLIMDYVRQSVPDALVRLAPTQAVLTDLANAKLQEVIGDRLDQALARAGVAVHQER